MLNNIDQFDRVQTTLYRLTNFKKRELPRCTRRTRLDLNSSECKASTEVR
ncbi:hypothetical protein C1H46_008819 [Malus baccata]|uniref:Uncharacterized protein n=1 Tax=Malus baccata TaxID=106549 RepID=A0A540N3F0_MALBA|nr:hypothetical protein C1H46_008819 [Malus baccata]